MNTLRLITKRSSAHIFQRKDEIMTGRTGQERLRNGLRLILSEPSYGLVSSPIITVPPDASIRQAVESMLTRKIRRLPIVDQGRLVGIVTERDLFKRPSNIQRIQNP